MRGVSYAPFFNAKLAQFRPTLIASDVFAIPVNSPMVVYHPEWIMKVPATPFPYPAYPCLISTGHQRQSSLPRLWLQCGQVPQRNLPLLISSHPRLLTSTVRG